ncbi:alpha/beta hydrolase [Thalassotalea nanhaiensis]|uniref:Alpha/beta hydrolase n=1 Tax=Thalassotalea nanhaiensis TaxID=3065648 RepID=A0ABY9TK20_9GAMM|nr:alpha/beta hydrolase [Colwelliaceae bacterium SQ345]
MSSLLLMCTFSALAEQRTGRSPARDIKVPTGITYEVMSYGDSVEPRANQIGIAYNKSSTELKPTVVFIHGGGWRKGDKDDAAWMAINAAQKGYIGITVSYRLLADAPFPACIEDTKQAIRFIKSLSPNIPIDTKRIGLWGYSAGAHLALMAALSPEDVFNSGKYAQYSNEVKSVFAVSGPTNFIKRIGKKSGMKLFSKEQAENTEFLNAISPLSYINKKQAPVTILHGDEDRLVKPYHYLDFKHKAAELGVENFNLIEVKGGNHTFYFKKKSLVKPIFNEFIESL